MLKGFKDFLLKGNLIEIAVGLVMALAIFAVVQALIADLLTPLIAAIVGEPSFADLSFTINDSEFLYGHFINELITFVSIAAAVYFFIVVPVQRIQERRGVTSDTQACPQCLSDIPAGAARCAFCTSEVRRTA
ncbi:MAG: large conductance mechanosensitive channel protein MscL [Solirubrobacterales bacterium]|nr:large conductance mechanosensitive channel protein MscL [Solirubrobacterales bacterium]